MCVALDEAGKRFFISTLVLTLASMFCISSINIVDTTRLDGNEGIMILTIVTNFCGQITIINQTNVTLPSAVISVRPGDNFRIMSLPAGSYSWRGIYAAPSTLGGPSLTSEFRGRYNFEIKAQAVNYIGNLLIEIDRHSKKYGTINYTMIFTDHGDETGQYLQKAYPQLSRTYSFVKNLTMDTIARNPVAEPNLDDGNSRQPEWHTPGTSPPRPCN